MERDIRCTVSEVSEPTASSSQNSLTGALVASSSQNSLTGTGVASSSQNSMTGGCGSCGSDPTTTGGETEGILGSDLTCCEPALKGKKAQRGGYTCCVPGCYNNTKKDRELSFHKFPREKVLQNVWINAIKRKDFVPTEHQSGALIP